MSNRLYVGNLAFHVTEDLLKQHVSQFGDVRAVDLILDRMSGRPRGFAFVEMESLEAMQKVIAELDQTDFEGRTLNVKVAEERSGGGGGRRPPGNDDRRGGGGRQGGWGRGR